MLEYILLKTVTQKKSVLISSSRLPELNFKQVKTNNIDSILSLARHGKHHGEG